MLICFTTETRVPTIPNNFLFMLFLELDFNGQLNCSLVNGISSNCMFLFIVNLQVSPKEIGKHIERARVPQHCQRFYFSRFQSFVASSRLQLSHVCVFWGTPAGCFRSAHATMRVWKWKGVCV